MKNLIYDFVTSSNLLDLSSNEDATIELKVASEIVIKGNRAGLVRLADCILNVAMADFAGWHIHLDEQLFDDFDKELIVELK